MSRLVTNTNNETLLETIAESVAQSTSFICASAYISEGGCALLDLPRVASTATVRIVVGRALLEGMYVRTREYLQNLDRVSRARGGGVRVSPTGFHSKLYAMDTPDRQVCSVGSSNLTENGLQAWREANWVSEEREAYSRVLGEADRLWDSSVDFDVVLDEIPVKTPSARKIGAEPDEVIEFEIEPGHKEQVLSISLVDSAGSVPLSSGLNWAFGRGRPRKRHECYIRLPRAALDVASHVFGSADMGTIFHAVTHDGAHLRMRLQGRAYADRNEAKQISTDGDNSRLGLWMIRECLGVTTDRRVTRNDLDDYGRTTIQFKRIGTHDDGHAIVFMDFGPA